MSGAKLALRKIVNKNIAGLVVDPAFSGTRELRAYALRNYTNALIDLASFVTQSVCILPFALRSHRDEKRKKEVNLVQGRSLNLLRSRPMNAHSMHENRYAFLILGHEAGPSRSMGFSLYNLSTLNYSHF